MTRETVSGTETADLPGAFDLFCGVRIIFFLSRQADFFSQNLTLGYMIIFYFLHQNQNIFSSNIGIQNIFLEKKHTPPPEVNIRLYDYFLFPPPKSEYFFQQHYQSKSFFFLSLYSLSFLRLFVTTSVFNLFIS